MRTNARGINLCRDPRQGAWREAKPGDTIPIGGVNVRVIAAGGSVLPTPLVGQGAPNPLCDSFKAHGPEITSRAADPGDSRSVSLFLTYGKFRTVVMGDLTWNKEFDLMCPTNTLGGVDVYLVSHHGSDTSGSAVLVHALRPRAAIMNNGPRKGGAIQTFQILGASPGLEDLWQNHYSIAAGSQHNRPEAFIANLDEGSPVKALRRDQRPFTWARPTGSSSQPGPTVVSRSPTAATDSRNAIRRGRVRRSRRRRDR